MRGDLALAERVTSLHNEATSDLPSESLQRLSMLAGMAFGESSESRGTIRLSVVSLPSTLSADGFTCDDTASEKARHSPIAVPPGVRAFALVPLNDAMGLGVSEDHTASPDLALCVSLPAPRQWTASDLAAVMTLSTTVATELQLRNGLAKHQRISEERGQTPLRDPLTDFANRDLFMDRIGQALIRCARTPDRQLAVLSLSVTQFENIESTYGYDAAHELLKELASRLQTLVRTVDSVARVSGDEFCILLESLRDNSDAARVANRVHEALRTPIVTTWGEMMVSANIGVVLSVTGFDSPARLIQLAGLARARATATGAAYEIFDPEMQQNAQKRLHKEMELRRAVEDNQFELYYQPIISLATGRIEKAEALLRWRHPKRGIVNAGEFIALAEQTGLIVALGWMALDTGCQTLRQWLTSSGGRNLGLSINITAAHLINKDLCDRIKELIDGCELPPGSLTVEITEGQLIGDHKGAKDILGQLRALGVSIHLDDFGTGYSSLSYLHELPLDAIKIDRSFIARLDGGGRDAQVVGTIRELARQMGIPVVAEGVETQEQLALVRALGCEYAQGYLFAKALPPAEMSALLQTDPSW